MSGTAEQYGRAIGSNHLELGVEPGDLDTVIAAGMAEGLGTRLLRLRFEFDAIRHSGSATLMATRLRSAKVVHQQLHVFASSKAQGRRLGLSDAAMSALVARVLDLWLDPNCHLCTGRGMTGEYGTPQHVCNACSGSTRRGLIFGRETEGFAAWLAGEMDQRMEGAQRKIRKLLQQM